ncbi:MAG: nickel-type superoxide dismutase maturation protease [Nitriliruptoraceae bacterium]
MLHPGLRRVMGLLVAWSLLRSALVRVHGASMLPALHPGDVLLTVPATPVMLRPGTVVVLHDPDDDAHLVVKRIARLAGDRVDVRGDNPAWSTDSRQWGLIDRAAVTRVAIARWPRHRSQMRQ